MGFRTLALMALSTAFLNTAVTKNAYALEMYHNMNSVAQQQVVYPPDNVCTKEWLDTLKKRY